MCVCVWRWVGESERMCGGNTHRSTERDRKKQKAERDSGGERREPVKQPTVFLPLFHLRDPHEAQLGYASWTSAPPPLAHSSYSCSAFPWRWRICLQMIASPAERLSWRQWYNRTSKSVAEKSNVESVHVWFHSSDVIEICFCLELCVVTLIAVKLKMTKVIYFKDFRF